MKKIYYLLNLICNIYKKRLIISIIWKKKKNNIIQQYKNKILQLTEDKKNLLEKIKQNEK